MAGEEGEAKGEVGGGEDGKSLDEDVGDGLVTGKVGVELVAILLRQQWVAIDVLKTLYAGLMLSDRANNKTSVGRVIQARRPRVIGNVVDVYSSYKHVWRNGKMTYSFNRAKLA